MYVNGNTNIIVSNRVCYLNTVIVTGIGGDGYLTIRDGVTVNAPIVLKINVKDTINTIIPFNEPLKLNFGCYIEVSASTVVYSVMVSNIQVLGNNI